MARVNITVPDELLQRARLAGLNVSRLAAHALVDELDRLAKIEGTRRLSRWPRSRSRAVVGGGTGRRRAVGGPVRGTPHRHVEAGPDGMTLVLDSGGVSALAGDRARLQELRNRGLWPPQVPAAVLAEALTGDHRRDFRANRPLRACQIREVHEPLARAAAALRGATRRASSISATDAIVAAYAVTRPNPIVITSHPRDLTALVGEASRAVTIVAG